MTSRGCIRRACPTVVRRWRASTISILYAASFPVFASTGEAIALLEARLPSGEIDASVGSLVQRLLVTAIVLAALAVLAGVILGQQVTGPVGTLTRCGRNGSVTAISRRRFRSAARKEVGKLARTMEDMRNNLVELTGALRRREAEAQAVLSGIVEGVYAVDKSRVIRYLNPQAARLLGVQAHEAIGRFCGDVLKPCAENGQRPCETRCPILRARLEGSAQATERLNLRERCAAHDDHHQRRAGRRAAGAGDSRRDRAGRRASRARFGAGEHLA